MSFVATTIGTLPGGLFSIAQGTNSNGTVIVGVADSDGFGDGHAFWWTEASGMVDLGVLVGGTQSIALACSADGSKIVGYSDGGTAPSGSTVAVLWTVTSGGASVTATELGYLGSGNSSNAAAISADGTTVTGTSTIVAGNPLTLPSFPFRWVSGVMTNLGLWASNEAGIGQAASSNGEAISGGTNSSSTDVPWVWTSGGGLAAMALAAGQSLGAGLALDGAGTMGTGFSTSSSSSIPHAFLWNGGASSLIGEPAGDNQSQGEGMSSDGTIIVGESGTFPTFSNAFYWTSAGGFVILPATGGTAAHAHAISGDGSRPVGSIVVGGQQIAAYWGPPGGITVPLRRVLTFAVSPLPYLLPD